MKHIKNMRLWTIASFVLFSTGLMCGWTFWDNQTDQYRHYMLGRGAYLTTMYDQAVEYFDQSYNDYTVQSAAKQDPVTAPPSLEMAELSQHFKALSLDKMGNAKLAIGAFKEALKLTNEYALSQLQLPADLLKKVAADRKITQIDFEILLRQKQNLAKKEGKGKDGSDNGEKQSEDPSKGNQAGKGDRDQL
jgi:tetratricopeptide (TPR) repeat protein